MATIANQRFISIRNIIIYLEIKFLPNRRIFLFWRPFWIQNGHHSKPTMDINSQHDNLLEAKFHPNRTILYFGGHFRYKMATVANQRWISIRNIIVYLETKFRPNRRIFVFWRPFWIQNGHHSKQKWSPYGAACLTTSKYPFTLKSFHL